MPFKLKLKKTRQYNVASKSLFVISVELLDGSVADCTLSVDSTAQDCLDNVCQRQAVGQPELFGLRYVNREGQPRWCVLERPLKRQLEKHATSHMVYFRLIYYIPRGIALVKDEGTRSHYFLQMKYDLIESRLVCDLQKTLVLLAHARQAEYGNHDDHRHTIDYMKSLLVFPKQMHDGGQVIDGTTLAETGKLEWLTEEVIQKHIALHNMTQAQAEEFFIRECQQLQGHGHELFTAQDHHHNEVTLMISLIGVRVISETTEHYYKWKDITNLINHKRTFSIECPRQGDSVSFLLPTPEEGKYVWRLCVMQHTFYMKHRDALDETTREMRPRYRVQDHKSPEIREELTASARVVAGAGVGALGVGVGVGVGPLGVPGGGLSSAHRARSTSCLELADHQPSRNRALLPSYRPAPDYETAVQQKYQQQRAASALRVARPMPAGDQLSYGSHPDIHRVHYPDVTRHYPFAINPSVKTDPRFLNLYKPPPPYPSGLASNSTPDLAVASQLNYHRGYIGAHVSGSSPDLVSTRTALNRQFLGYLNTGSHNAVNYGRTVLPSTHGTYSNLASVLEPTNPRIVVDGRHLADKYQNAFDDRANVFPSALHAMPYPRHMVMPQTQISKVSDTAEPIYENVPLPWLSDLETVTMRDRAQSLTTTDEIVKLNERNSSHPAINTYGQAINKSNITVPSYKFQKPSVKIDSSDSHYVNAEIIQGVRESSVPKETKPSRSISKPSSEIENVSLSVDRLSLKNDDETPYQSLSTHRVSNSIVKSSDNVTCIAVEGPPHVDTSAISGFSTSIELDTTGSTKNISVSSKEKKRRRWGVFMGRAAKPTEVKSATLGRERSKAPDAHRWSTGLPKQPLPPSITKETLCQLLERKMSDEQLAFAFEQISKGRTTGGDIHTGLLPAHAALNGRPGGGLPYEDNRVRLAPTPANPHGYINASHVTMTVGSTQRFYVVIKVAGEPRPAPAHNAHPALYPGPASNANNTGGGVSVDPSALFWECLLQVGARLVALLGAKPHYLPEDNATRHYGKFTVSTSSSSLAPWGRAVRVRVAAGGRARALWHVHYERWPAAAPAPHSVPDFLGFLSELNGLRLALSSAASSTSPDDRLAGALADGRNAPLALACDGGDKAGLALAADHLLHVLDNNQELDIPRTISMLHQQRANLIQNVQQYKFLHQVLLQYLRQSRLI